MFFKRKSTASNQKLSDVVNKVTRAGYIFWNINDDLGHAADQIMRSSAEVKMAYGYTRRAAVAALYLQGLVSKDVLDHVCGIFKALQQQTGHSVEFQEKAAEDSIDFMQGYNYLINALFVKRLIHIAEEYESRSDRLTDSELFAAVMDTIYAEQESGQFNLTSKQNEIAKCLVELTSEPLSQIDMELSEDNAKALIQTISQQMNEDSVMENDAQFVALQVVEYLSENAKQNEEYDALCMFALSVAWGSKIYAEEHALSGAKADFVEKMKNNALELVVKNKQFVESQVAKNFIAVSFLELL